MGTALGKGGAVSSPEVSASCRTGLLVARIANTAGPLDAYQSMGRVSPTRQLPVARRGVTMLW